MQHLQSISEELQRRLDDASNGVRIASCAAMCQAVGNMECQAMEAALVGVSVHLDDDDEAVQEAVSSILMQMAAREPKMVATALPKACRQHRHQGQVQHILQRIQEQAPR